MKENKGGVNRPLSHFMSWILIVEQSLNGLQFGLMLFLLAAGLTLVFGIMDMINLAHGSLYMLGAFLAATLVQATGSFAAGVLLAIPASRRPSPYGGPGAKRDVPRKNKV